MIEEQEIYLESNEGWEVKSYLPMDGSECVFKKCCKKYKKKGKNRCKKCPNR